MTDTHDDSSQPERATAVAAGGNARLSSPRTDAGVEHDRMLQREKEQFSGMHFGVGFFGWLTATGLTVLLTALITGIAALFGAQQASGSAMSALGVGGAIALLVVLLIAYFCGGYVAGRMARRAGLLHGIAVFVLTLVTGAIAGGLVALFTDDADIRSNLRGIGVPTDTDQLTGVAIASVVVSLAAILIGAALGGILGERWHTRLAARAADPEIGPAAEARAQAQREDDERRRRLERDQIVGQDARRHDGHGRDGAHDGAGNDDREVDLRDTEPRYTAREWQERTAHQSAGHGGGRSS